MSLIIYIHVNINNNLIINNHDNNNLIINNHVNNTSQQ